jgi:hypothetical protein
MSNPGYRISRIITPATDQGLITLDDAKVRLGIDPGDTSQDDKITAMIATVSQRISNYCDRLFPQQVYRDQFRGVALDWQKPLHCRQFPVATDDTTGDPMLTVTVEGAVLDPSAYDVSLNDGALYLINGVWSGLIVLDYTAGYQPIPADLQAVAGDWLQERNLSADRDPSIRSETVSDATTVVYGGTSGSSGADSSYAMPPSWVCESLIYYRHWYV